MNKNTSKIHLEILDNLRQELLQKLLPLVPEFVLGGGTALSLQIKHRISLDFDFFSLKPIPKQLLEKLSKSIEIENIAIDTPDELTFFTKQEIKVTFLNYPFRFDLNNVLETDGLRLFNIYDIAVQKAYTIGRRGEYRDYFDLYIILKDHHTRFDKLVVGAKKVYGSVFDEKMFLIESFIQSHNAEENIDIHISTTYGNKSSEYLQIFFSIVNLLHIILSNSF